MGGVTDKTGGQAGGDILNLESGYRWQRQGRVSVKSESKSLMVTCTLINTTLERECLKVSVK